MDWKATLEWGVIIVLSMVMLFGLAAQFWPEAKPKDRPVPTVLESREYRTWTQH